MSLPRLLPRCASTASACVRRQSSCPQCLRPFSTVLARTQESRRRLQTVTAYRPTTLDAPPPPANAGPLESSIASKTPPPPRLRENQEHRAQPQPQQQSSTSSPSETKEQKLGATASSQAPSTEGATSRPKRSRLRPRKAAMTLTPPAVEHLRNLLSEGKLIRVGVKNRGCSGLAYNLEYVDKSGPFDEAVEQDGVKVLIDSKALFSIIGSEMDWMEDKLSARFVFKNPNISKLSIVTVYLMSGN